MAGTSSTPAATNANGANGNDDSRGVEAGIHQNGNGRDAHNDQSVSQEVNSAVQNSNQNCDEAPEVSVVSHNDNGEEPASVSSLNDNNPINGTAENPASFSRSLNDNNPVNGNSAQGGSDNLHVGEDDDEAAIANVSITLMETLNPEDENDYTKAVLKAHELGKYLEEIVPAFVRNEQTRSIRMVSNDEGRPRRRPEVQPNENRGFMRTSAEYLQTIAEQMQINARSGRTEELREQIRQLIVGAHSFEQALVNIPVSPTEPSTSRSQSAQSGGTSGVNLEAQRLRSGEVLRRVQDLAQEFQHSMAVPSPLLLAPAEAPSESPATSTRPEVEARASTAAPAPDHVPDSDNEVSEEDSSEEVERIRSPPAPKRRKRSTRRYR